MGEPLTPRDSGLVAEWRDFGVDVTATQWKHKGHDQWKVLGGGSASPAA